MYCKGTILLIMYLIHHGCLQQKICLDVFCFQGTHILAVIQRTSLEWEPQATVQRHGKLLLDVSEKLVHTVDQRQYHEVLGAQGGLLRLRPRVLDELGAGHCEDSHVARTVREVLGQAS